MSDQDRVRAWWITTGRRLAVWQGWRSLPRCRLSKVSTSPLPGRTIGMSVQVALALAEWIGEGVQGTSTEFCDHPLHQLERARMDDGYFGGHRKAQQSIPAHRNTGLHATLCEQNLLVRRPVLHAPICPTCGNKHAQHMARASRSFLKLANIVHFRRYWC
ncbi:hypothetical protein EDB86DRAFT_2039454 [Lactarius hatsudake]|nr:hypothetical protein EDB86DRAFT_2039454 [Lactarius hatsudake]